MVYRIFLIAIVSASLSGCLAMVKVVPTPPDHMDALNDAKSGKKIDLDACVIPSGHGDPPMSLGQASGSNGPWDHQQYMLKFHELRGAPPFKSLRAAPSVVAAREMGCDLAIKVWATIEGTETNAQSESISTRSGESLATLQNRVGGVFYQNESEELKTDKSYKKNSMWVNAAIWRASRAVGPLYASFKEGSPLNALLKRERAGKVEAKTAKAAAESGGGESASGSGEAKPAAPKEKPKPKALSAEEKSLVDSQL